MQKWQVWGIFSVLYLYAQPPAPPDTLSPYLIDSLSRYSPVDDTVYYEAADSIVFYIPERRVFLYDQVKVRYEQFRLETGYAWLNLETGQIYGYGIAAGDTFAQKPIFYYRQERYDLDSLRYNLRTRRGQVFGMRQNLSEEALGGRTIQVNPDGTFFLKAGYYTTCTAHPPHFYIASTRLKLYPGEKVVSGPLYAVVSEVPIPLFLPFGYFPLVDKRTSGIILPFIGQAADRGFFIRGLGYYWAINDYMDFRVLVDLFTRGGYRAEVLWTYRKRYWYDGSLSIQHSLQSFNEPGDPDYQATRMTFVRWQHRQTLSPTANLSASVQAGSSTFLARQSYTATEFLSTNLQSSIALQKTFPHSPFQLTLSTNHTQNLLQKSWQIQLPVLALYQNRLFPFERKHRIGTPRWYERIGYTYRLDAQQLLEFPESLLFKPPMYDTARWGLRHNIQISAGYTLFRYLQLTPTFTYNEYLYSEQLRYEKDSTGIRTKRLREPRTARDFAFQVAFTTRLYGVKAFRGRKGLAIRHTLIPTLAYQYKPDFSKPTWGLYQIIDQKPYNPLANGFYGSPSPGLQQAIQFSLNNLLEAKYKATPPPGTSPPPKPTYRYLTLLDNVSLSGSYNFAADSFRLSPLTLTARTNLAGSLLNLSSTALLDPYEYTETGQRRPRYQWDVNRRLGTLTQITLGAATNLQPKNTPTSPDYPTSEYVYFHIPWNLQINYNLVGNRQFRPGEKPYQWVQTLNFSAEVRLTYAWRIQLTSGYDFIQKRLSFTSVNLYRDLHCWEFSFNWIPFGPRQSYFLTLSARSPKLQDLRITKRRDWQDRFVRGLP